MENYFNIKSSTFTRNGIEIPQIILPLETTYTEEYLIKKLNGDQSPIELYNNNLVDSSKREMIQDGIYNALMNDNF